MNITKISFNEEYKQFQKNTNINFKDLNILIGINGIGKSTTLKIIDLFFRRNETLLTFDKKTISLYISFQDHIYKYILLYLSSCLLFNKKIKKDIFENKLNNYLNESMNEIHENGGIEFCMDYIIDKDNSLFNSFKYYLRIPKKELYCNLITESLYDVLECYQNDLFIEMIKNSSVYFEMENGYGDNYKECMEIKKILDILKYLENMKNIQTCDDSIILKQYELNRFIEKIQNNLLKMNLKDIENSDFIHCDLDTILKRMNENVNFIENKNINKICNLFLNITSELYYIYDKTNDYVYETSNLTNHCVYDKEKMIKYCFKSESISKINEKICIIYKDKIIIDDIYDDSNQFYNINHVNLPKKTKCYNYLHDDKIFIEFIKYKYNNITEKEFEMIITETSLFTIKKELLLKIPNEIIITKGNFINRSGCGCGNGNKFNFPNILNALYVNTNENNEKCSNGEEEIIELLTLYYYNDCKILLLDEPVVHGSNSVIDKINDYILNSKRDTLLLKLLKFKKHKMLLSSNGEIIMNNTEYDLKCILKNIYYENNITEYINDDIDDKINNINFEELYNLLIKDLSIREKILQLEKILDKYNKEYNFYNILNMKNKQIIMVTHDNRKLNLKIMKNIIHFSKNNNNKLEINDIVQIQQKYNSKFNKNKSIEYFEKELYENKYILFEKECIFVEGYYDYFVLKKLCDIKGKNKYIIITNGCVKPIIKISSFLNMRIKFIFDLNVIFNHNNTQCGELFIRILYNCYGKYEENTTDNKIIKDIQKNKDKINNNSITMDNKLENFINIDKFSYLKNKPQSPDNSLLLSDVNKYIKILKDKCDIFLYDKEYVNIEGVFGINIGDKMDELYISNNDIYKIINDPDKKTVFNNLEEFIF